MSGVLCVLWSYPQVPALHAKVIHDMGSEEEKIKEASSAMLLGEPHDTACYLST